MNIDGNKLTASEGKILTNGDAYGTEIYLGIYDSPENWYEIDEINIPQEEEGKEEDPLLAFHILLGLA